ncbi:MULTISPECIES: hypothetical protein [Photorhabdus]|uniref:Uncharacterized protein n=2 Tax=Photorhabdus TaxID=29487 RepID=A0ABX0B1P1_9GAMM|nr:MULTISPECIES: hypothetical protein [Photorhabdus]MCC8374964.1 hypothetical protein [Photorhabdus bodei]MCC8465934.1 hypothetical protein [Photorhabdus bodei]MCT8351433.1 hypothetical protein [Photorhabdus kayaii]MDB6368706.1 hypothetical protein [Photorhabdus bodei]MDB6371191.1 hypothetical protein [Photorhabdus bodei]
MVAPQPDAHTQEDMLVSTLDRLLLPALGAIHIGCLSVEARLFQIAVRPAG